MTLCIAALCSADGETAATHAVVVSDGQIETDYVGADLHYKLERLTEQWSVLCAGEEDDYVDLIAEYRELLPNIEGDITAVNAMTHLIGPPNTLRSRHAETCTRQRLALSYPDFLKNGKVQLPEETQKAVLAEILRQRVEADLLLIGPVGDEVAVFNFNGDDHRITRVWDFAAIGSGDTIAQASFFQRGHDQFASIQRTLYVAFEAQKAGQAAPSVGASMQVVLIDRAGKWKILNENGSEQLQNLYEHYFGPRDLNSLEKTPTEYMELTPPEDFFTT
jgi:hypothetical protein